MVSHASGPEVRRICATRLTLSLSVRARRAEAFRRLRVHRRFGARNVSARSSLCVAAKIRLLHGVEVDAVVVPPSFGAFLLIYSTVWSTLLMCGFDLVGYLLWQILP